MIIEIVLGTLLIIAVGLLIHVSKEKTKLEYERLQYRRNAMQLAMQITKTHDKYDLADDAEILALVVYYTDIATGAEIREGRSLPELIEHLKTQYQNREDLAEEVKNVALAHKFMC